MRRRSALSTLAVTSLVIAACSGGDDDTSDTTEPVPTSPAASEDGVGAESEPAGEPADEPAAEEIDADLASAMWVFDDVAFETNDLWRGTDADGRLRGWQVLPGAPSVVVADNADGHVAFVSDDLVDFRPVHRGCCGLTLADRLGDRIAIVSVGAATTAFVSPDGGITWTTAEVPALGGTPESPFLLSDLIVTESGYVATATPSQGGAPGPGAVFTSTDLVTWTTVALPGVDPAISPTSGIELLRGGAGEIWIVALVDDGASARYVPFRTLDGGLTIEPQAELATRANAVATVADRLVLWPADAEGGGPHPWLLVPDAGWARAPADTARWGADGVQVPRWGIDAESGRIVAVIERFGAEPAAGCDPAVSECELQTALVTSADGLLWSDVDAPSFDPDAPGDPTAIAAVPAPTGRDGWLIWRPDAGSNAITAYRWTGPAAIPALAPDSDGLGG